MLHVLSVGNSFSEDAQTFLCDIANAAGEDFLAANLYIGGCPLALHWENAKEDARAYQYFKTGCRPSPSSIREALLDESWDVVTLQQASHFSGMWETYEPYLSGLSDYIRRYAPDARQWIHQTWAYEWDSSHEGFARYKNSQQVMYEKLKAVYELASTAIHAPVIPCGDAMQLARSHPLFDVRHGGTSLCRDGFHASLTHGRYLLGAVFFEVLSGKSIQGNPFVPSVSDQTDLTPSKEELTALWEAAHRAVQMNRR